MKGPLGTVGKRDPPRGRFSEIHRKPHFGAGWARATFPRPGELLCPQRLSALSGGEKPARIWVSPVAGPDPQSPRKRFQREQNRLRDTRPCRGGGFAPARPQFHPGAPPWEHISRGHGKNAKGAAPAFFRERQRESGRGRWPAASFFEQKSPAPPRGAFCVFLFL